jgi:hypothetical protein
MSTLYNYFCDVKSGVREAFTKAGTSGSKKKGGKGKKGKGQPQPAEEEKAPVMDKCTVFVGLKYPEYKQQVLEILTKYEFDENNKLVGNFKGEIQAAIKDKKQAGLAMGFASFVLKEAEVIGKKALMLEVPFDETVVLNENLHFIFENMPTVKVMKVVLSTDEAAIAETTNAKNVAANAVPGKPAMIFFG